MPIFTKGNTSVLFIHVPKTGGSSLEQVFVNSGWEMTFRDPIVGPHSPNWYRRCSPQHMHAEQLELTFRLERFDSIFMTVREPLARFRSEYGMRNPKEMKTDEESAEVWAGQALTNYLADPYVFDNHLRPQTEFYLPGCHAYQLEDGLEAIVDDLNRRFDLDLEGDIPRVMDRKEASGMASSEVKLTPRLESRLRQMYATDFVQFGY